jgi:DNA-binding winged helix-turn-helix (wHTH) protein/Tol biopolymer transport system component
MARSPSLYRFDDFELDGLKRRLLRQGRPVALQPKAFDLLLALVENPGRLLPKDDLLHLVWPDQIVEESNLTVHMSALRRALGEHRGEHRFVVTEPGRGYRFVADVAAGPAETPSNDEESTAQSLPASAPAAFPKSRAAVAVAGLALLVAAGLVLWNLNHSGNRRTAAIASAPASPIALTRLTNGGNVTSAVISPDGKHFAYTTTESAGQSLWIRQVGGGRSIRIAPPEAVEYWGLTFSPDGAHVYSSVFDSNRAHTQLRRVPALGGPVESLGLSPLSAITFSPDGRRFAFVQTNAAAAESLVKVANADGSDARVLARRAQPAYFDFLGPTVSWSRDGDLIASVVMSSGPGGDYMTVVGVRADGTGETVLTTKRWAGVSEVAWSRSGGLVVVATDQPSTPAQVWLVTRPGGDARPLTSDLNVYSSISTPTDARTLMLLQRNSIAGLWVQSVAGPSGEARRIGSEVGGFDDIGWMPDGRLVYRSSTGAGADLWILDMKGTAPAQVTTNAHVSQGLATSPDGRYVVFAATRAGTENLWRYGVTDGTLTQLTDGDGELFPRVTGDSRWVIYQRGRGVGKPTLWRVSIDGGPSSPLVETHAMRPDLSPDGQSVAYFSMDLTPDLNPQWRIVVASVHDGSFVRSFEIPATLMPRVLRFTPDGQALAYIDTVGGVGNIWQQPLAGGPPQQVTTFDQGALETFGYSRDGRLLAMTRATRISDVAVIRDAQ